MKKHILITNDDGIESRFMHAIAHALGKDFDLSIAAPKSQQSWIGRAVSRTGSVSVEPHPELPWPAWTIGGTPTDCVNIAIGNLLESIPDAVVSGINIGYNTTTQLIYSSGTVAGAMEGAFWGIPAIAISQEIPDTIFFEVARNNGLLSPEWQVVLDTHAAHAANLIRELLDEGVSQPALSKSTAKTHNGDAIVHNLNYPSKPVEPLAMVRTVPAPFERMSFFHPDDLGGYEFHFKHGKTLPAHAKTDREAIASGEISHSILNFSGLGRDLNH
jgi:5'-nucleotidase